jgi:hypothetical protein
MKKIIYALLTFILFITITFSQNKDRLIQLYSGIGDTLDYIDKEIFDLYPDIEGYKYAQLFNRDDEFLVSNITYVIDGLIRDTLLINDFHQLYLLRQTLSKFISENDKKLDSPLNAILFTKSGNSYNGKLQLFCKKYLYLSSDFNYLTENSSGFDYKTPFSHVDSIQIAIKSNVGAYAGYGALGGFALGFIAGIATFNDDWGAKKEVKWLVTGAIGAGTGFLIGWLIGELMPPDFVNIRFNTPYDVTKLKDYSAYYFQYNKAIEDKYVELD